MSHTVPDIFKNFDYDKGSQKDQTRSNALCQMLFVARKEN